jgi:hypothetical protein
MEGDDRAWIGGAFRTQVISQKEGPTTIDEAGWIGEAAWTDEAALTEDPASKSDLLHCAAFAFCGSPSYLFTAIFKDIECRPTQGTCLPVSIHKWPFSAILASIRRIICARHLGNASAQSVDFLHLANPDASGLHWKRTPVPTSFLGLRGWEPAKYYLFFHL